MFILLYLYNVIYYGSVPSVDISSFKYQKSNFTTLTKISTKLYSLNSILLTVMVSLSILANIVIAIDLCFNK
jgi:hypothetical protein